MTWWAVDSRAAVASLRETDDDDYNALAGAMARTSCTQDGTPFCATGSAGSDDGSSSSGGGSSSSTSSPDLPRHGSISPSFGATPSEQLTGAAGMVDPAAEPLATGDVGSAGGWAPSLVQPLGVLERVGFSRRRPLPGWTSSPVLITGVRKPTHARGRDGAGGGLGLKRTTSLKRNLCALGGDGASEYAHDPRRSFSLTDLASLDGGAGVDLAALARRVGE